MIVGRKNWNLDDIIQYIRGKGADIEEDRDGQIIICTGLCEDQDGNLVEIEDGD